MEINGSTVRLLKSVRILDLADEKASFCSKLLSDLGASVVKVEKPGGDPSRKMGTLLSDAPVESRSLFFAYQNVNKDGITLDITEKEGRHIFLRLLKRYDIVVETFPPGHLDELGLGYNVLSQTNPRLILVSVTGFGQKGPLNEYKSCDIVASAYGGQMHVSGSPSTPPVKAFGEQPYYAASLFAAIGILLALRKRSQSGKGEHIDISLQEAVASTLDHVMVRYFNSKTIPQRTGSLSWNNDFCILPCEDGHILVTLSQQWETLIGWMETEGMAEDLSDDRWRDEGYRLLHGQHIRDVVGRWTETHTRDELFELAQLMRFPWAPVYSPRETVGSPQLKARGFFVGDHSSREPALHYPGSPYKFNSSRTDQPKRAPFIGEHNLTICRDESGLTGEGLKSPRAPVSSEKQQMNRGILDGLRVLDFTWMLAGPYATRILADFGAEVIKVQSKKTARGAESNLTGYFNAWNRNKYGITLNLSHPEARNIALRLTELSDVVIENFSPRVMPNWGLSYARLKEAKPDLIMASISAVGQDGPWKDFVAFGPTLQALSGFTYLTSFDKNAPTGIGYAYADPMIGLYTALAVLSALEHRDKTGQGQYIDISGFEAVCTLLGPALMDAKINQREALPHGNRAENVLAAPYGCYKCLGADRWCVIAVFKEDEWKALSDILPNSSWMKEDRFSTLSARKDHKEELDARIEQWTSQRSREEVVPLLQAAGIPAGVVQDAEDLARDVHLMTNQFFQSAEHSVLGKVYSDRSPIRMKGEEAIEWKAAPLLGEDNRYVLRDVLGLSEEEFQSYAERGIIS